MEEEIVVSAVDEPGNGAELFKRGLICICNEVYGRIVPDCLADIVQFVLCCVFSFYLIVCFSTSLMVPPPPLLDFSALDSICPSLLNFSPLCTFTS